MLKEEDKKGVHKHPQVLLDGFSKTIEDCELVELDLLGGKFTWEKSRGSADWVRERIDRAFASSSWCQLYPLSKLTVYHTIYLDHDLIRVEFFNTEHLRKKFRFRFENTWLKEKEFHEEVSNYWQRLAPVHLLPKPLELSTFMEKWGRKFFNKFREKIKKEKETLSLYEACIDESQTKKYFEEEIKLEDLFVCEEAYRKQRAKTFWLVEGDANSKFFHAFATTGKKKSVILKLKDDAGNEVTDHERYV